MFFPGKILLKITRGIKHFRITCKQEGVEHRKGNNESWGGRALVHAGGDGKQGIYVACPNCDVIVDIAYTLEC